MALKNIKALTFDCYGTLIDWEAGILSALRPYLHSHGYVIADARILEEFGRAESRIERDNPDLPYTDVLRHLHHALARRFGIAEDIDEASRFAGSVGDWPPFPDTVDVLRALQTRYKLVVVSNTDRASFAATRKRLGLDFDAVVIAEDVGAYKPDHRMFQRAIAVLSDMGIERQDILHVAQSLYHDHVPAKELGMRTVCVDRYAGRAGQGATLAPTVEVRPDYTVSNLWELDALLLGSSG